MMETEKLKDILQRRLALHINDEFGLEECWKEETALLSENIPQTINFLINICSDEEFFWISEVFEDVAEKTQSYDFIAALRARLFMVTQDRYNQEKFKSEYMRKYIDYEEYVRSISQDIDYAEGKLD